METLHKIHASHQGIVRCQLRATSSVWWPGISKDVESYVKKCPECVKMTANPREPLLTSPLPKYPWENVATDLFQHNGSTNLLAVDNFSRYPEVIKLNSTTSQAVISSLKSIYSHHGIPTVLVSDNGPQFDSRDMKEFASTYGFQHITSSPCYPQSNGLPERMVNTVKSLLRDTSDSYLALLSYRATLWPWCNYSPSELLIGRRVKTDIPQTADYFKKIPRWHFLPDFQQKDKGYKEKQKENYDLQHRTRSADVLPENSPDWVRTENTQVPGRVISTATTPRSYVVSTLTGIIRRNQQHLNPGLNTTDSNSDIDIDLSQDTPSINSQPERDKIMTTTQTGTQIGAPDRLAYN